MGLCYGTPDFPTPSFTGHAKSGMKLTISSSSSSAASKTISSSSSSAASNSHGLLAACNKKAFGDGKILAHSSLTVFSFAELKEATKNFHDDALLGEGGLGYVYKGMLRGKQQSQRTKTVIAVKKLKLDLTHGYSNWLTEIQFFGRLSHPNLAKLLGFCQEDENLAFVYEFMQKGSLNNHLFRKGSTAHLPWDVRLKIMVGAARGLAFLHNSGRKIRYREFKTSNILLDGFYTAKLTDFGLVKSGPPERESSVATRVMSTCGYAAPEYIATGHLYVKSDVYGFGLVLLEILTGLSAYDPDRSARCENLVEWVKPFLSSKIKLRTLVDPGLKGNYCIDSAFQIAQLALKCLQSTPNKRPSMTEVVEELESIEAASANRIPRDA